MIEKFERRKIGEGIYLTEIVDPKFKANVVRIRFCMPLDEDNAGANVLTAMLLMTSNAHIRSRSELTKKFAGLYGSSIGTSWGNISDFQQVGFSMSCILDKYTIGGEKVSGEAMRELMRCIFEPDMTEGLFSEKYFALRKQELLDNIRAAVNDKRSYAYQRAKNTIYSGEPAALPELGSYERAEKITREELSERYGYMLKSAAMELTVCGGGEAAEAVEILTEAFGKIKRENVVSPGYRRPSPLKKEPAEVSEPMELKQSKMFMAFKSQCRDIYLCKVFVAMLGGSPFSKLFANVREKLSLCYYCDCAYSELKGTMFIDSGLDNANTDKARAAIMEQLRAMQEGDFTDEELENTKLLLKGGFKSNYDSEWDIAGWYAVQNTRGTSYSPEEVAVLIDKVTREQVVECAKSFELDSVFILKAVEKEEERNG